MLTRALCESAGAVIELLRQATLVLLPARRPRCRVYVPVVRQMLRFRETLSHKRPVFGFFDRNHEISSSQVTGRTLLREPIGAASGPSGPTNDAESDGRFAQTSCDFWLLGICRCSCSRLIWDDPSRNPSPRCFAARTGRPVRPRTKEPDDVRLLQFTVYRAGRKRASSV